MPRIRLCLLDSVSNEAIATVEWQLEGNVAQQIEPRLIRLFDSELLGRASLTDVLRKNPEWQNVQRQRDATLNVFVQRRVAVLPSPSTGSPDSQVRQCLNAVREAINRIDGISQIPLNELNLTAYSDAIESLDDRARDAVDELSRRSNEIYAALAQAGMPSQGWKTHATQIDALRAERDQARAEQGRLQRQLDQQALASQGVVENLKEQLFALERQRQDYADDLRRVAELEQQIEILRQKNRRLREEQPDADESPAEPRRPQGPI